MQEVQLSLPIKLWLEELGVSVQAEVGKIDLMGVDPDGSVVAVELKKSLNLEVINQAVDRQRVADIVYIGIPYSEKAVKRQRFKETLQVLRRLHIGLLLVKFHYDPPRVEEYIEPKLFDLSKSKRQSLRQKERLLKEFKARKLNINQGGVTRQKIMTAYREQTLILAHYLKREGEASPAQLAQYNTGIRSVGQVLNKNYYGWFEKVSWGLYTLSEEGYAALQEYEDIIEALLRAKESIQDGKMD